MKLCTFVSDIENSTKQSLSSCKTEIVKPDAYNNSFVTVLTVIAVVCIACNNFSLQGTSPRPQ